MNLHERITQLHQTWIMEQDFGHQNPIVVAVGYANRFAELRREVEDEDTLGFLIHAATPVFQRLEELA